MAQFARPSSDVATNSWSPSTGATLYGCIDEATASDTDYIGRNVVSYSEVGLSSISDPVSSADHVVRYRLQRSRTDRTLTISVRLMQGATEIAAWEHINPGAWALSEQTLSSAQADAITDYGALSLRFDITALQNTQVSGQVSWAELETPDAGVPNISLDVADAYHVHAAGAVDVTQSHSLSTSGAYHTHSAEAIILTQNHALAVAAAYHAHVAPNLTVTSAVATDLVVANSYHVHAAQAANLTQVHSLAVAAAYHIHSAGASDLTHKHVLQANSAYHIHSAGAANLTQLHSLEVNSAYHLQEAGAANLTQEHELSADSAYHVHESENIGLVQTHVLSVANCYHPHAAQEISFALVQLELSDYIAASAATSTTAQLDAPSGKASGTHFQAGRISDDTNPLPSIDLESGKYTELEWCIQVSGTLGVNDEIELRVTANGTPLDTYAETPKITIVATAGNLVVASTYHDHSADNVSLSQEHTLVVQGGYHLHQPEAIELVQTSNLVLDSTYHAHAAAAANLTQIHALSVNGAYHTHVAETLTLTQKHVLAVASAYHAHVVPNLTVTGAAIPTSLVVGNAYHLHTAGAADLTQGHSLTVAAAYHAHVAPNLAISINLAVESAYHLHVAGSANLTQEHSLAVAAAYHIHSAGAANPTQIYSLTVQGAYHLHAAGAADVTQVHALTVAAAYHAHAAGNVTLELGPLQVQSAYHGHVAGAVNLTAALATLYLAPTPGIDGYWGARYTRNVYSSSGLFPGHNQIRIRVISSTTHGVELDAVTIGPRNGTSPDFTSSPTAITFNSGQAKIDLAADTDAWSDWIDFAPSGAFLIHTCVDQTHRDRYFAGVGYTQNYTGDCESQTLDVTMTSWNWHAHVAEVQTRMGPLAIDNASHLHSAEQADIADFYLTTADAYHLTTSTSPNPSMDRTDLIVQSCYHSHTAEEIVLGMGFVLTVANAAHEHFAEGLDVVVLYLMTVAACYHAHDGPNLTLTQDHTLAVSNAFHEHQSPNIAITAHSNLLVDGCAHLHTVENTTVGQDHTLVVQSAVHESSAQAVALTAAHHLATQDAAHGTHSDALALTGIHYLSVDNAAHAHLSEEVHQLGGEGILDISWQNRHDHTVESIVLDQRHILTVADGYHDHSAEPVVFTQHHIVRPNHCYHGHTAQNVVFVAIAQVHYTQLFSLTPRLTVLNRTDRTSIERWNGSTRIAA